MADIEQNHQDESTPPAPTSPLVKLVQALGGGKKKPPAGNASAPGFGINAPGAGVPAPVAAPKTPGAKPAATPMPQGALVTIMTRNEFYRDGFRSLLRIAIVQAIVIVCLLIAFVSYVSTSNSQDRYFATTADGRIMQLVPLDRPNMATAALMSWVAQATSEIMTFGFHDYQRRLQQSSRHFTQHGWETFTVALNQSHIIEAIQAAKQVLTASPRNAPILVQEGVFNGKYRWIVKIPLQVSYKSGGAGAGTSDRNENLNVTLVIDRVPSIENPNGVGIEQWISTQG